MRRNGTWLPCLLCGTLLYAIPSHVKTGRAKYCSKACATRAKGDPAGDAICGHCGASFLLTAWRTRRSKVNFCSVACHDEAQRSRTEVRSCLSCGQDFRVHGSDRQRALRKFCSLICRYAGRQPDGGVRPYRPSIERTCVECGATWRAFASTVEKFAARTCSACWRARFRTSEDRNGWEYRRWRKAVYERDDFTCRDCGQRGRRLHAHHVKDWANHSELRYDVANGLTLCLPCHGKRHPFRLRSFEAMERLSVQGTPSGP